MPRALHTRYHYSILGTSFVHYMNDGLYCTLNYLHRWCVVDESPAAWSFGKNASVLSSIVEHFDHGKEKKDIALRDDDFHLKLGRKKKEGRNTLLALVAENGEFRVSWRNMKDRARCESFESLQDLNANDCCGASDMNEFDDDQIHERPLVINQLHTYTTTIFYIREFEFNNMVELDDGWDSKRSSLGDILRILFVRYIRGYVYVHVYIVF